MIQDTRYKGDLTSKIDAHIILAVYSIRYTHHPSGVFSRCTHHPSGVFNRCTHHPSGVFNRCTYHPSGVFNRCTYHPSGVFNRCTHHPSGCSASRWFFRGNRCVQDSSMFLLKMTNKLFSVISFPLDFLPVQQIPCMIRLLSFVFYYLKIPSICCSLYSILK